MLTKKILLFDATNLVTFPFDRLLELYFRTKNVHKGFNSKDFFLLACFAKLAGAKVSLG